MKRVVFRAAFAAALFFWLPAGAKAAELIPVGRIVALQLRGESVTVAAYDDVLGGNARSAGLKIGDELIKIGSASVSCAEDVLEALETCGDPVELTVRRGGRTTSVRLSPNQTQEGPRLGVYLRQGVAGIGTVTFYDPETGLFGTLGHGVCDSRGALLPMRSGSAYAAAVQSVKRGTGGDPGQLRGAAEPEALGSLLRNTPQGVFGRTDRGWTGMTMETAAYDQIIPGPAVIRATVTGGEPREYSVEILKIYPESRSDGRNFLLRVTDPDLLAVTGGIVQGMSGSPIIQDGKLVGAVTHVLVNDPTRGYGIFVENMLTAAS